MKTKPRRSQRLGLLANGASPRWDVAVDESVDGAHSLELDGKHVYLVFQLKHSRVIREAVRFLQPGMRGSEPKNRHACEETEMLLGSFGSASVSLLWDNEDVSRCFLVIGPKARATLRLSLDAEDIEMLGDALEQVMKELRPAPTKRRQNK